MQGRYNVLPEVELTECIGGGPVRKNTAYRNFGEFILDNTIHKATVYSFDGVAKIKEG
jgi:hypothetical protein